MENKIEISGFADEIAEDLKTQIEVIKKLGISHIEMRGVNGKPLVEHSLEEVKEVKRQLDENQIKLSSIGSPIGKILITEDFEEHFELYKKTVEIAKIMETPYIRMFSFFIPEGEEPEKYKSQVFERLQNLQIMPEIIKLFCSMKMRRKSMEIMPRDVWKSCRSFMGNILKQCLILLILFSVIRTPRSVSVVKALYFLYPYQGCESRVRNCSACRIWQWERRGNFKISFRRGI